MLESPGSLGARLTAGRSALDRKIGVRIPGPQPRRMAMDPFYELPFIDPKADTTNYG